MVRKICYFSSVFFVSLILQLITNFVDSLVATLLQIVIFFLLFPFISFLSARMFASRDKKKWALSLLCPFVLTLSYIVLYLGNSDIYPYALKIFIWSQCWSLLGLIRIRKKDCKEVFPQTTGIKKKMYLHCLGLPAVYCLLFALGYFACRIFMESLEGDWGGFFYVLLFFVLYVLVLAPATAIFYCKKIHTLGWIKYLCCIYNAIMTAMYFPMSMLFRDITEAIFSLPTLAVGLSSLICGMATLIIYDAKHRQATAHTKCLAD